MKPRITLPSKFRAGRAGATFATAIVICLSGGAMAQTANNWTGAVSTAWNTPGNWSEGVVPTKSPGNHHAVINVKSPNIATISAGIVAPVDIIIGQGAGSDGQLDHIDGDAFTGSSNWMFVGRNSGVGKYNLANVNGTGGTFTGFATGSGNMTVSGRFYVGGSGTDATFGNGVANINTTGTLSVGSEMNVGAAGGTGVLNLDNGTITTNGPTRFGFQSGSKGTLNMSGGSITKNGADNFVIGGNGTQGVVNMTGGTINVASGETFVSNGTAVGTTGTFNFSGGTFTANNWLAIGRGGATGVLNLDGGTLIKQSGGSAFVGGRDGGASTGIVHHNSGAFNITSGQLWIGQNANTAGLPKSTGTYNLNGGTVTVNSWFAVGREGGIGTLNISGGTFTKQGGDHTEIGGSNGAIGLVSQSGGTFTASTGEVRLGMSNLASGGSGTWTMTSGSTGFANLGLVRLAHANSGIGTINLNGGTMAVTRIEKGDATGTATVNFNGGTLQAKTNETAFLQGLNTADVQSGGALINSNGFNITIGQTLTGTGGLVKSGGGTLTLTGANSYAGTTTVNDGKLNITTASAAGGDLVVNDFTGLGLSQTTIDDSTTVSAASFGFESTLDLNLGNFPGNTTAAPLDVAGTLTLDGPVYINVVDANPAVGTIPLVSYDSRTLLGGGFELQTLPDGVQATLVDNGTDLVSLNVTRVNDPYWTGAESEFWNTSAVNWIEGYSNTPTTFANGDPALFNDSATGTTDVVLNTNVAPGGSGVTFANSTLAYTLTGTGSITGDTGLRKEGSGSVTIGTTNSYTGVTTLAGGTTNVAVLANGGVDSPLGAAFEDPENLVLAGGVLNYTGVGATPSTDRGFLVTTNNSGIGVANAGTNLTISGMIDSTGGGFVKSGPGTLTLTNDDITLAGTGGTNVSGGTLVFNGGGGDQIAFVPGSLHVGNVPNVAGHLAILDSDVSIGGWLAVGRGNGDTETISTVTVTDSFVSTGNLSAGFDAAVPNDSTQIITVTDSIWNNSGQTLLAESTNSTSHVSLVGSSSYVSNGWTRTGTGANSVGSLTLSDTSSYTSNGRFQMALNGSSQFTLTIEEDAMLSHTAEWFSIGNDGTCVVTVRDNGILQLNTPSSLNIGDVGVSNGTLHIQNNAQVSYSGGAVTFIGKGSGTSGTVNISGGSFSVGTTTVADATSSTGTIAQTGGVVTMGNNDRIWFGNNGQAVWNQSNGGVVNASGWLAMGRLAPSNAQWNVSGSGTVLNHISPDRSLILAESGQATLTVSGGGVIDSQGYQIEIATRTGSTGTLNVNAGGTLRARQIMEPNAGTSALNFDGGTVVANADANIAFITAVDTTTVNAGGVTVDSNGQTIGIDVAMLAGSGSGGLTKTGAGFLQLNGTNTYTGTTTVSAGSLGGTGSVAGPLLVSGTGTLAPGASVGTFTSGSATIAGTYAVEIDGATSDVLAVNGNLNLDGATIAVSASAPAGSQWTIATYSGTLSANIAGVTAGYTLDTGTPGVVKLVSDGSGSNYQNWAQLAGLTGANDGPTVDAESDGIVNMLEFVLGGNPLASDTSILPDVDASGANFVFTFNRSDESETEIGLVFQYGSNLTGWTDVVIGADNASSGAGVNIAENGAAPDTVTVTVPKGANAKLFGRLKAQK